MTLSSLSGPVVAVTGASGFIGSHVCRNLVAHGYTVRACVRDISRRDKTEHLLAMNSNNNKGSLDLFAADMMDDGAYDDIFTGCSAVFHVAGNFGTDKRWIDATTVAGRPAPIDEALGTNEVATTTSYDQGVYDSYVLSTKRVLDSILRSKTVKRLVYTSSACAGPCISENDDVYSCVDDNAYGKGKVDSECLIYAFGEKHGIICCSCCPDVVLGPLLAPIVHDTVWQHRLGEMFAGKYCIDMGWNIVDVRDVADTQRRMAESPHVKNGSRYFNGSPSEEELSSAEVLALMKEMFPAHANQIANAPPANGGNSASGSSSSASESDGSESGNDDVAGDPESDNDAVPDWNSKRVTRWGNPEEELGLQRHTVKDTIRDTILSLLKFNAVNRKVSTAELRDYYNVAEMDGCGQEMEYILSELKKRGDAES